MSHTYITYLYIVIHSHVDQHSRNKPGTERTQTSVARSGARSSRSHGGFAGWYHWYPHSSQWTLQGWPEKCLAPQRGRRFPPRCLLADIPRKTNENSCLTFFHHVDQLWYCMILYGMINRICDTEGRSSAKCFMAGLTFGYLWPGGHPYSIQFFHAAASSNSRFGDPAFSTFSNCFQNISKSKDVHSPTDMWHERLMTHESRFRNIPSSRLIYSSSPIQCMPATALCCPFPKEQMMPT